VEDSVKFQNRERFVSEGLKSAFRIELSGLFSGILAFIIAVLVAAGFCWIEATWSNQAPKANQLILTSLVVLGVLPAIIYLLVQRREAKISSLGLIAVGTITTLLIANYLFREIPFILFPADVLIWSESDYVNDILKFREGYPMFTANANNDSFTYVPGSQLVTYFLAWLSGNSTSVAAYRVIQVGYILVTAIVGFLCCRRLLDIVLPTRDEQKASKIWSVIWLTGLFLIASNGLTNPFTHLLHNDSLAQLVTVTAFWLLLEYETTKDYRILILMALMPAVGFWVKQSVVIWFGLYFLYLLIFDQPRSFKKLFGFSALSFGAILVSFLTGYLLWQENFIYWVFTVLRKHEILPSLSYSHLLDVRVYVALGIIGGAIVLFAGGYKRLVGLWLVWASLISVEIYTSGVAWMLNHIGPGSLIAGIWFFAGVTIIWKKIIENQQRSVAGRWIWTSVFVATLCLIFLNLGIVRKPVQFFSSDAYRYVREIEQEFDGQASERVLLDLGTWVYFRDGVVMKDRAPAIGERGYSQTGDFSGVLQRLEGKQYTKILVRNLDSADFWYDDKSWSKSSNIRQTMLENYQLVGTIKAVEGIDKSTLPYGFKEVSILIPRNN
jgi:hypothetical protein